MTCSEEFEQNPYLNYILRWTFSSYLANFNEIFGM